MHNRKLFWYYLDCRVSLGCTNRLQVPSGSYRKTLKSPDVQLEASKLTAIFSRMDNQTHCAFYYKSMTSLSVLVHTIRFIFRCGGKSHLTSGDLERSMTSHAAKSSFFHDAAVT